MKKNKSLILLLLCGGFVLLITDCSKDEETEALRKDTVIKMLNAEISSDSLESAVNWLQGMVTRFALSDNHRNIALQIQKRYKSIGFSDTRLDSFMISRIFQSISYQQWQYNVVATLNGNTYPDSVCIIGGHYDDNLKTGDPFSVVPGANDNAGGVAAALEIGRVMMKNKYKPRNTIEFVAFGSEELGLYGSTAYAAESVQKSKKIMFMLNNDMIAYQQSSDRSAWTVNIIDYDNSHSLRSVAENVCKRYTSLKYINDNTYNKQSDSYPFYNAGYKALFFFSANLDPNYHTLNDLVQNCNFEYSGEIVKLCCALLVSNN
jgi:hypothetical protein